jgi:hypothetical protein
MSFIQGTPAALLAVEYAHAIRILYTPLCGDAQARGCSCRVPPCPTKSIWNVRKAGLGILQSQPGDAKAISFIEDLALPVEKLGNFVREMDTIS